MPESGWLFDASEAPARVVLEIFDDYCGVAARSPDDDMWAIIQAIVEKHPGLALEDPYRYLKEAREDPRLQPS